MDVAKDGDVWSSEMTARCRAQQARLRRRGLDRAGAIDKKAISSAIPMCDRRPAEAGRDGEDMGEVVDDAIFRHLRQPAAAERRDADAVGDAVERAVRSAMPLGQEADGARLCGSSRPDGASIGSLRSPQGRIMIGRLNHVAIAVPDIAAAAATLSRHARREGLGSRRPMPEHGVTVVFVELPNTKIELLEPLGEHSPIAEFRRQESGRRHSSPML